MNVEKEAKKYVEEILGTVQQGSFNTNRRRLKAMLRDAFVNGCRATKENTAKPLPRTPGCPPGM